MLLGIEEVAVGPLCRSPTASVLGILDAPLHRASSALTELNRSPPSNFLSIWRAKNF